MFTILLRYKTRLQINPPAYLDCFMLPWKPELYTKQQDRILLNIKIFTSYPIL